MASIDAGPVVSCDALMRYFDCTESFYTCFPFEPPSDQGPCDSRGGICEDWNNCRRAGHREHLDWDCTCDVVPGGGMRWTCMLPQVCPAESAVPSADARTDSPDAGSPRDF